MESTAFPLTKPRSVDWAERHRLRLVAAALEVRTQQDAGAAARCGYCGFWEPRHELESDERDGVEALCCLPCLHARREGLQSRLDVSRMREALRA